MPATEVTPRSSVLNIAEKHAIAVKANEFLSDSRSGIPKEMRERFDAFKKIVAEELDDEGIGIVIGIMDFHFEGFEFLLNQAKNKKFAACVGYKWTEDCDGDYRKLVRLGQLLANTEHEEKKFEEIKSFLTDFYDENVRESFDKYK